LPAKTQPGIRPIKPIRLKVLFWHKWMKNTTWVSWDEKGKTNLDLNEARDDGMAVASAGPYADHLHLAPDR